jgi:hypothetical protein
VISDAHGNKTPGDGVAVRPVAVADQWGDVSPLRSGVCRAIHSAVGWVVTVSDRHRDLRYALSSLIHPRE